MKIWSKIQQAMRRAQQTLVPDQPMRVPGKVLVIGAHPDDCEAGCGATVAKLVRAGAEVTFLVATNGALGDARGERSPAELVALRRREQEEAARVLGVKQVIMLDHRDGELWYTPELRAEMVHWLRTVRPDTVITHCPDVVIRFDGCGVNHADHRALSQAVIDAVYPFARIPNFKSGDGGTDAPHSVRELFLFNTLQPDHWEDVTKTAELKVRSLEKHASQVGGIDLAGWMLGDMKIAGAERGMRYAESFRRLWWW